MIYKQVNEDNYMIYKQVNEDNYMIYKQVNFQDFCDSFGDRTNFSYHGKQALFDYLENLSEDTGENIELDPIAICCDYTQYDNLAELQENYNNIESMEDLKDNTQVIEIEGSESFIIIDF